MLQECRCGMMIMPGRFQTRNRSGGEMKMLTQEKEEKKVEYLELIYDLIFVYIIGRNNSLLQAVEGGFVPAGRISAYILCTLAIIQIWYFSTFYINMFGRNSVRDHVFLFINMYLLYYIGEGTRLRWEGFRVQYHAAWALILINIGVQYLIELRNHRGEKDAERTIRHLAPGLFTEAVLVLLAIPPFGIPFYVFSALAILAGIGMTWFYAEEERAVLIDFGHLTERAMLYVVFTFGEMIIAIASYFEGELTINSIYFSLMAFLIVSALFLSYEMLYNHIIDRERRTTGMAYMMIHIFLIFSMNNITAALEFMRDPEILLIPRIVFLILAFLLFYICLFGLMKYAKRRMGLSMRFILPLGVLTALFVVLMFLFRENMKVNIAISVVFVFAMFLRIYMFRRENQT